MQAESTLSVVGGTCLDKMQTPSVSSVDGALLRAFEENAQQRADNCLDWLLLLLLLVTALVLIISYVLTKQP